MSADVAPRAPGDLAHALLRRERQRFAALAEGWLAAGASAYSAWRDDLPLAIWPPDAPHGVTAAPPALSATLRAGIELRIAGVALPGGRERLLAEVALLDALADREIELGELTSELIDRQDQLLALYDLAESLRSRLSLPETVQTLADQAAQLVGAEGAFAVLITPGGPLVCHAATGSPRATAARDSAALLALFEAPHRDGRELLLRADEAPGLLPAGIESLLLLPVRVRGEHDAALGLCNKPGGFFAPDLKLARAIAAQAGGQIENVLLHEERVRRAKLQTELDLAAKMQLQLLPQRLPGVAGLEIAAASRPALQVGGDFYDVIAGERRPWLFSVGDVAGKGVAAALLMSRMHAVIHNAAKFMPDPTPAGVLRRVNEDLYDDFTEVGLFATAFVGRYDPATAALRFANAGHSPVIHCPAGGAARLLAAADIAIGILPDQRWGDETLTMAPGDLLVVATDGLSEAMDLQGAMFGHEALLRAVEEAAPEPAQAIVHRLLAVIARFAGDAPQADDQTLVVIKCVAAPAGRATGGEGA